MPNPKITANGAQSDIKGLPIRLSDMRIAITGGSGRVGSALRQHMAGCVKSIKIVDTARPEKLISTESWDQVDITDAQALGTSLENVDAVVHLAGHPNERSIEDILHVNVLGTHNVLEAARQNGIKRVVFGSSNHAVGFYPRQTLVSDSDPMRPDSLYGLSKCWGELEAGLYFDKFGIRTLNIRIGNAGDRPNDARALNMWVSARDLAQLVMIGLEHPDITCTTVFGVSRVPSGWWDNSTAAALGYKPVDAAEAFAGPETKNEYPTRLPEVAEHFQGGRFCVIDHDGTMRRRMP